MMTTEVGAWIRDRMAKQQASRLTCRRKSGAFHSKQLPLRKMASWAENSIKFPNPLQSQP
jgi:hypothetical protein